MNDLLTRHLMNSNRSFYNKVSREGALVLGVVWLAFQFAERAGYAKPPPIEADIRDMTPETAALLRGGTLMLQELHSGRAPLDHDLVPQWAALRQLMEQQANATEKLTRALDRNASSTSELNYWLQEREPISVQETLKSPPQRTWFQRLSEWLRWDAAG